MSTSPRQFKINRSSFSRHYTVLAPDGQPLYYVDQSAFAKDKANLTLHAGADGTGAVVAVAHLPRLSRDVKVGLGDPSSPSANVAWEELNRESRDASAYQWSMTLPGTGERKTFIWKRTHSVSAEGMSTSALSMRDLKLVEVAGGDGGAEAVVGVFTAKRGWSSCGVLQINSAVYGGEFDVMVTMTVLAIYEKARRRRAAAAAGGASS